MNEQTIQKLLHEIEEERMPESVDLWPAIRAQAAARPAPPRRALRPTTRLGWVTLLLVIGLFVAGAGYAVTDVITGLFRMERGLEALDLRGLYTEIDQSHTIDGVTVTVERAYADANRIVVAYSVESADGQRYDLDIPTLTDGEGNVLPGMYGLGAAGRSETMGLELPPGAMTEVMSYDATSVQGEPEELALRLTLSSRGLLPMPDATVAVLEQDAEGNATVAEAQPVTRGEVQGVYQFEFTVPFVAGQRLAVQETMVRDVAEVRVCPLGDGGCPTTEQVQDVAVLLEEVILTPSGTSAALCLAQSERWSEKLSFIATVQPAARQATPGAIEHALEGTACGRVFFLGASSEQSTTWTLTVNEIIEWTYSEKWNEYVDQRRIQGPWQFTFEVP